MTHYAACSKLVDSFLRVFRPFAHGKNVCLLLDDLNGLNTSDYNMMIQIVEKCASFNIVKKWDKNTIICIHIHNSRGTHFINEITLNFYLKTEVQKENKNIVFITYIFATFIVYLMIKLAVSKKLTG